MAAEDERLNVVSAAVRLSCLLDAVQSVYKWYQNIGRINYKTRSREGNMSLERRRYNISVVYNVPRAKCWCETEQSRLSDFNPKAGT